MSFETGDLWTVILLGGGFVVILAGLLAWRSVKNRAARASAAASQAEARIQSLLQTETDPDKKEALEEVSKEVRDLLELLPEADRLPGMAILVGAAIMFMGVVSAGIITLSTPGG